MIHFLLGPLAYFQGFFLPRRLRFMEGLNPRPPGALVRTPFSTVQVPGVQKRKIRNLPQTLEMTSLGPKLGGGFQYFLFSSRSLGKIS